MRGKFQILESSNFFQIFVSIKSESLICGLSWSLEKNHFFSAGIGIQPISNLLFFDWLIDLGFLPFGIDFSPNIMLIVFVFGLLATLFCMFNLSLNVHPPQKSEDVFSEWPLRNEVHKVFNVCVEFSRLEMKTIRERLQIK